ncbi:hypothetical protein [Acinetobacter haemolyticus]|uniref:Transposase n=1 Tax=Acinetobacter haemolyticus TaxID=29430 RepID=A0A4P7B510_ACIHA|nr:hypothetical protein [Acinetobacter haemolyticus]QBQ16605.1 hypothetical protein AHTJR_10070 [Acinetobacter haemolyticus]
MSDLKDHEVVSIFKQYLYPLSAKLTEMLNEHFSHQTERRGCGYTQATRVIDPRQNNGQHVPLKIT